MVGAILEKSESTIKGERRFRCKYRKDVNKPGRSASKVDITLKCTDGSFYRIIFSSVQDDNNPAMVGYCEKKFPEDERLPDNLVDKQHNGKLLYNYLIEHDLCKCNDIYEDVSHYYASKGRNKASLEKEMLSIQAEIDKKKAQLSDMDLGADNKKGSK